MASSLSILAEFDCSLLFMYKSSTHVVYVNSKHPLSQFQILQHCAMQFPLLIY